MRLSFAPLPLLAVLAGCSKPAEPAPSAAPPPPASVAARASAKLSWTDPPAWKRSPPSNPMRLAEYSLPKSAGDADAPECVVNTFGPGQGGTVDANVDRWIRQFDPASASSVEKQSKKIGALDVTIVELSGTWRGMTMPGAPPSQPKSGQRMLAAIVDHPTGLHFFKIVGPDASVKEAKGAFVAMLETLR